MPRRVNVLQVKGFSLRVIQFHLKKIHINPVRNNFFFIEASLHHSFKYEREFRES